MGRVSRSTSAWAERLALAESLHALVATDLKAGAAFPTEHTLHVGQPTTFAGPDLTAALAEADVILSLDWVDLGGTLRACPGGMPDAKVIQVSLDHHLHNGWSMDHQALPPVDLLLEGTPRRRRVRPGPRAWHHRAGVSGECDAGDQAAHRYLA